MLQIQAKTRALQASLPRSSERSSVSSKSISVACLRPRLAAATLSRGSHEHQKVAYFQVLPGLTETPFAFFRPPSLDPKPGPKHLGLQGYIEDEALLCGGKSGRAPALTAALKGAASQRGGEHKETLS